MKRRLKKRKHLRDYVLGTHNPEQEQQLEERLLTDEKLLAELSVVEDELLYDYVSDTLPEAEQAKFEARFLNSPEGQRDLQFFKALKSHVENLPPAKKPLARSRKSILPAFLRGENFFLRVSVVTASVIIVFVGLFAVFRNLQNPRVNVFTVALGPGTTRIIGEKELNLVEVPPDTDEILLQLPINDQNAETYTASLFTDTGEEKLTQENLRIESTATGKAVTIGVPSSVLASGDYRVKIKANLKGGAVEDVASYSFRVFRR